MKVYLCYNYDWDGEIDMIKIFLNQKNAESYCEKVSALIEEHEVIE
jgi:hypothetical protein